MAGFNPNYPGWPNSIDPKVGLIIRDPDSELFKMLKEARDNGLRPVLLGFRSGKVAALHKLVQEIEDARK